MARSSDHAIATHRHELLERWWNRVGTADNGELGGNPILVQMKMMQSKNGVDNRALGQREIDSRTRCEFGA
jgi:hypothetical protein